MDQALKTKFIARSTRKSEWVIEFPEHKAFEQFLRSTVPDSTRQFDLDGRWVVHGRTYLDKLEKRALRDFDVVTEIFIRGDETIYKDVATGKEEIQPHLFTDVI